MNKPSRRIEQDDLRARMRAAGMTHDEIAVEFARRYSLRPRVAHRTAHGWTLQQAAGHINAHAARAGLDPDGTAAMTAPRLSELESWPVPLRRRPTLQFLVALAEVYGTDIHGLLDLDDRENLPAGDRLLLSGTGGVPRGSAGRGAALPSGVAPMPSGPAAGTPIAPGTTDIPVPDIQGRTALFVETAYLETVAGSACSMSISERRVVEGALRSAATESSDVLHVIDSVKVGEYALEQFDADIRRIVSLYSQRPALSTFLEVRGLRTKVFSLLTQRHPPSLSRDLCYLSALLSGVLANSAFDLGSLESAPTHARVAFACADQAGHNGLRSWIRGAQSMLAYWDDRLADAVALAQSGWRYVPERGTSRVRLAALEARSLARMGDEREAVAALGRADQAREHVVLDDDPGGMLAFPLAKQLYYASSTALWLTPTPNRLRAADQDAGSAVSQLEALPDGQRRVGEESLAHTDVALARLLQGDLDGAASGVRRVIEMSSIRRVESAMRRLGQFSDILARPFYRDQTLVTELREEISPFVARPPLATVSPSAAREGRRDP